MDLGPFATILGIWKDQGQPWKNYTVQVVQQKLKVVCQDVRRGTSFEIELHYQPLPPQLNWKPRYSLKLADFNPTDIRWRFPNGKQANHWRRPAPPEPPRPPLTPPPAFSAFPSPSPAPVKRSRSRSRGTSADPGIRGSTANAASFFEEDDDENAEQALPVGSVENSPKAVEQEEVRIVVMTCGLRDLQECEQEANYSVDMRSFYDPGCGPLKKHDGRHHEIIRRMVHHHLFMDLISDLRTRLAEHEEAPTSDGCLHFLLYCKSGRHRSVAAGTLLHYILLSEGYSAVELQHVSLGDGCGCDICSKPSAQRCLACEEGLRKWRNKD